MSTTTQLSELPAIEYPDDDGNPMSEDTLQNDWMVTIKGGLSTLFLNDPNVFVACNLLWYPVQGDPTIRIAPDAMVVFGRPKGRRGSYKQWEEGNQPPHVVFEVLAPGNRPGEMDDKLRFYDQYGVEEYYAYDPDDGSLEGWRRVGQHLTDIPQMAGYVSPRLGIRFEPGEGPDNLKIFGPDGAPFLTFDELHQKSKTEELRADEERSRAEEQARITLAERQRAQAANERAERLAARLRELGVEPE
jgi:Uma2 family endonuclease